MAKIKIEDNGGQTLIILSDDDTVYYNGQVVKGSQIQSGSIQSVIKIGKSSVTIMK